MLMYSEVRSACRHVSNAATDALFSVLTRHFFAGVGVLLSSWSVSPWPDRTDFMSADKKSDAVGAPNSAEVGHVGVLGGSFNPIHYGHLDVARAVSAARRLDRVLFLPARQPPHKTGELAPAAHRLRMVELACEEEPRFVADDLELQRPGPSYTVDTLAELRRRLGDATLYFIIGADLFAEFSKWRQPQRILSLARLIVVNRPGAEISWRADDFPQFSRADLLRIERDHVRMPPSILSSTDVRAAVRAGRPLADLVPAKVARYILENRLYQ